MTSILPEAWDFANIYRVEVCPLHRFVRLRTTLMVSEAQLQFARFYSDTTSFKELNFSLLFDHIAV